MTLLVRRHPLETFWAIAIGMSFVGGYLSWRYPSDGWAVFVYGPFIGAFIVTALDEGRAGLRAWLGRVARWRVDPRWYLAALLLPVLLQVIALGLGSILGMPRPTGAQLATWPAYLPEFVAVLLFIGLAEEPGFRGFALQRQLGRRSVLAASLVVGALATVWHLPLFVFGSESPVIVPIIIAGAILLSWIYVHTEGSVLLTMLCHASVNTSMLYVGSFVTGAAAARHLGLLAAVYVAAAVVLVVVAGPDLARSPAPPVLTDD